MLPKSNPHNYDNYYVNLYYATWFVDFAFTVILLNVFAPFITVLKELRILLPYNVDSYLCTWLKFSQNHEFSQFSCLANKLPSCVVEIVIVLKCIIFSYIMKFQG